MKYLILIPLMTALLLAGTHEFDYSELHPYLYDITQLDPNDSYFIVGDGTDWIRETGATVRTSLGLGMTDTVQFGSTTVSSLQIGSLLCISDDAFTYTESVGEPQDFVFTTDSTNGFNFDDCNLYGIPTLNATNIAATNIGAFNLTGKLTAGATEIEGSAFDINGGYADDLTLANSCSNLEWDATYDKVLASFEGWDDANTHISNDGTDHSYIDQDLQTSASPTFAGLVVDTDTLIVDDVNDRVGIGTSSPDSVFHIKANIAGSVGSHSAGQIIIQNPTDSVFSNVVITGYESDSNGDPDQQLWYLGSSSAGNTDIIFLNRRNAKLALGTNGISRLTILGNGNVGIGTATPSEALDLDVGNLTTTGWGRFDGHIGIGAAAATDRGLNIAESIEDGGYFGIASQPTYTNTEDEATADVFTIYSFTDIVAEYDLDEVFGIYSSIVATSEIGVELADMDEMWGIYSKILIRDQRNTGVEQGSINNVHGLEIEFGRIRDMNIGTALYGAKIGAPTNISDSTIPAAYGLYLADWSGMGTAPWAIYSAGGDSSHAGNFRIGSNVAPTVALDVTGEGKFSSHLSLSGGNELRFYDVGDSNYVGFEAPALTADQIWVLPNADGSADEVIKTDGAGALSFVRMPKAIYAELSDSTDQEFAVAGTPNSISFDTNDEIAGITHSTSDPNITIITAGVYTIFAQPQVAAAAGGAGVFHMWLQKDTGGGFADIANTNIELSLASLEEDVIPLATTFMLSAGDIIRLQASVSDTRIKLDAQTPAGEPTIPSIIFTMFMIGT